MHNTTIMNDIINTLLRVGKVEDRISMAILKRNLNSAQKAVNYETILKNFQQVQVGYGLIERPHI